MRRVASILLALAACGDQRPGDATPDATTTEQPRPVTVSYFPALLGFLADCSVWFQAADGSLVLATHLNAGATANAFMPDGGSVTLVCRDSGALRLWTWVGVRPGDPLVLDLRVPAATDETAFEVSVPLDPQASTYQLSSKCGTTTITGAQVMPIAARLPACDPVQDLVLLSRAGGGIVHGIYLEGARLEPSTTIAFAAPYAGITSSTVTLVDAPPLVSSFAVTHGNAGTRDFAYAQHLTATPNGGNASLTFDLPALGKFATRIDLDEPGALVSRHVVDWTTEDTHHFIDYTGLAPPDYAAPPSYDAAHGQVRWTVGGAGRPPDAVIAGLQYLDDRGDPAQWTMLAPYAGETVVTFPVLPFAGLQPPAAADVSILTTIGARDGYDSFRTEALGRIPGTRWPMSGDSGRAIFLDLGP